MNIGELFINLGIKGTDKTVGQLSDVSKGMNDVKGMSIEAKAAILGAIYALQRMTATSGALGTSLVNLEALTGISGKSLQQWRWAMVQAGGSAEEMDGIFKNLQKTMTAVDFAKAVPEGFSILAKAAGGIDWDKKLDPVYMAGKMRDAIKNLDKLLPKEKIGLTNLLAGNMGIPENFISGARRGKFEPSFMARAPLYGEGELKALDANNIKWKNLAAQIEMAFGRFNIKHGGQLVDDIGKITKALLALSSALLTIAEKFKVFETMNKLVEFITLNVQVATNAADLIANPSKIPGRFAEGLERMKKAEEYEKLHEKKPTAIQYERRRKVNEILGFELFETKPAQEPVKPTTPDHKVVPGQPTGPAREAIPGKPTAPNVNLTPNIAPTPPIIPFPSGSTSKTEIHQNLNFHHDGKDAHATADSTKNAIEVAYRQIQAQGRGA